jgi:hypothetical protein
MNDGHNVPADGVGAEHMAEETSNIAQPIGFKSMNRVVILGESGLKKVTPKTVNLREPLSNKPVEL